MAEPDFRVQPGALTQYADLVEQQREQIGRILSALSRVQLPDGAFGQLPDEDELHRAYDDHATAEQQNLTDLLDVLRHASDGLRTSEAEYHCSDADVHASLTDVLTSLTEGGSE